MTLRHALIAAAALALLTAAADAQNSAPAPDNSKANANSMNSTDSTSTAQGQSNSSADITLAQQIRREQQVDTLGFARWGAGRSRRGRRELGHHRAATHASIGDDGSSRA